jgi:hypothetical protein
MDFKRSDELLPREQEPKVTDTGGSVKRGPKSIAHKVMKSLRLRTQTHARPPIDRLRRGGNWSHRCRLSECEITKVD